MKIWPWVIGWFIAMMIIICIGTNKAHADQQLTKQVIDPSVQVFIEGKKDGKNEGGSCSGTVVLSNDKGTFVLLAKHCFEFDTIKRVVVSTEDSSTIQFDGHSYPAHFFAYSKTSDLAIVILDDLTVRLPEAKLGDMTKVEFGDKVWVASHPEGFPLILNNGYMASLVTASIFTDVSDTGRFYMTSVMVAEGSSGSGLFMFDGTDYVLVGVCTGIINRLPWVSFFTPIDEIRYFISGKDLVVVGAS